MKTIVLLLALSTPALSIAAQAEEEDAAPAAPRSAQEEGEEVPEIRIVTKGNVRHEEYRLHGRLYMIKVIPRRGKPYYLVDQTGSGQLTRRGDPLEPFAVPQWVIKRY